MKKVPNIFADSNHLKGFFKKHRNIYNMYKRSQVVDFDQKPNHCRFYDIIFLFS